MQFLLTFNQDTGKHDHLCYYHFSLEPIYEGIQIFCTPTAGPYAGDRRGCSDDDDEYETSRWTWCAINPARESVETQVRASQVTPSQARGRSSPSLHIVRWP